MILAPAEWYPFRPASGMGVYELRIYRLAPGKVPEWMGHFRAGLPAREKYSAPVGLWATEIGPLNTVAHLWAYRDSNHRIEARAAAYADPVWKETLAKITPLMQTMEAKLLIPTDFSPLK
jgi:hypothetical protein